MSSTVAAADPAYGRETRRETHSWIFPAVVAALGRRRRGREVAPLRQCFGAIGARDAMVVKGMAASLELRDGSWRCR